jgi:hypothetical protein
MATITKGKTFVNGELVTPEKIHQLVDSATIANITNADLAANAAIADTKLAQISTAGKVLPTAVQGTAVITTDSRLSDARTPTTHTHDDRYYTETEVNSLLAGKQAAGSYAAASHTHDASSISGTATNNISFLSANSSIANETGGLNKLEVIGTGGAAMMTFHRPGTYATYLGVDNDNQLKVGGWSQGNNSYPLLHSANFSAYAAPANHNHDDRYYTETEINTLLAGKQASGSYAPASGIAPSAITGTAVITTDSRLSDARTPTAHTHDDRYYTELEIGTLLSGKANIVHNQSAETITSGTLANARTTATSSNLINTIVARNNFGGIDIALITGVSPGPSSGIYNINTSTGTYIGGILTNSTNTGVIYSTSSDHRLKTDLEKLTGALDRLSALPVHRFKWVGHPTAPKVDGFLAHEAQAVVPEAVTGTKDAVDADGKPIHQGIDQSKLVPLLVAAVQELAARVAALEAK